MELYAAFCLYLLIGVALGVYLFVRLQREDEDIELEEATFLLAPFWALLFLFAAVDLLMTAFVEYVKRKVLGRLR